MYLSFILHMLLLLHVDLFFFFFFFLIFYRVLNFCKSIFPEEFYFRSLILWFFTIAKNPKFSTNKVGVPVITLPPPGWDASSSQGSPQHFIRLTQKYVNTHQYSLVERWSVLPKNTTQRPHQVMSLPINPSHPHINMHILHAVLYTFSKVLIRRICLTIKRNFSWWSFPLFSWC